MDMECDDMFVPHRVEKSWGYEYIFANNPEYCGKILHFKSGGRCSLHFHIKKMETWYVARGRFRMFWIDTETADVHEKELMVGDVVHNDRGKPHQLVAIDEGSEIFEVSTQHFDCDSYRVGKGDSQI